MRSTSADTHANSTGFNRGIVRLLAHKHNRGAMPRYAVPVTASTILQCLAHLRVSLWFNPNNVSIQTHSMYHIRLLQDLPSAPVAPLLLVGLYPAGVPQSHSGVTTAYRAQNSTHGQCGFCITQKLPAFDAGVCATRADQNSLPSHCDNVLCTAHAHGLATHAFAHTPSGSAACAALSAAFAAGSLLLFMYAASLP